MNIETLVTIAIVFIALNVILFKYGRKTLSKSGFRTITFIFYSFCVVAVGVYLYRFGLFGHMDYIDGLSHQPERVITITKPVPPKFDTPKSQVWDNAKQEHRNNVDSFAKP